MRSRRAFYGPDLAWAHRAGFARYARAVAPELIASLRRRGLRAALAVDLGCGSGELLRALDRAGCTTLGVDGSAAMLALARSAVPRAKLLRADVHTVELPACDAVSAIGEVLAYVAPTVRRVPALAALFRRVWHALRPGGVFVFDLVLAAPGTPWEYRTWRAGRDWAVLIDVTEDQRRRRVAREILTFRRSGKSWRLAHERHELQVVTRSKVERALRAAGFRVRATRRHGDALLPPRRLAFWAHKPGGAATAV